MADGLVSLFGQAMLLRLRSDLCWSFRQSYFADARIINGIEAVASISVSKVWKSVPRTLFIFIMLMVEGLCPYILNHTPKPKPADKISPNFNLIFILSSN
jgi:hypothetical protein